MNYEAFFRISYGLYVISSSHEGRMNGYIGNTVFQVTAEPPRLAISCNKDNFSAELIRGSGLFSVSILEKDCNKELLGTFGYKSGRDTDKFSSWSFTTGSTGVPILTQDAIAWFECKVVQTVDVGSHLLFIADILNWEVLDESKEPLTYAYYRETRKGKAPKNAPTYIDESKLEAVAKEAGESAGARDLGPVYRCLLCGHEYDPAEGDAESGIAPGTPFADLPDDWECPVCGASKEEFKPVK